MQRQVLIRLWRRLYVEHSRCIMRCGRITESQNHRMFRIGRDLCGSSSPTPLPKQGHPEQAGTGGCKLLSLLPPLPFLPPAMVVGQHTQLSWSSASSLFLPGHFHLPWVVRASPSLDAMDTSDQACRNWEFTRKKWGGVYFISGTDRQNEGIVRCVFGEGGEGKEGKRQMRWEALNW